MEKEENNMNAINGINPDGTLSRSAGLERTPHDERWLFMTVLGIPWWESNEFGDEETRYLLERALGVVEKQQEVRTKQLAERAQQQQQQPQIVSQPSPMVQQPSAEQAAEMAVTADNTPELL